MAAIDSVTDSLSDLALDAVVPRLSAQMRGRMGAGRIAIYCRVSSVNQTRGGLVGGGAHVSLEAQQHQIERFCIENGLTIVWYIEDVGSARVAPNELENHKGRLLKLKNTGADAVDAVIVITMCRFSRNLIIGLNSLQKLNNNGVAVLSLADMALYTGRENPDKYTWYFGLTYAERESDAISARVRGANNYIRSRGGSTARPAFGQRAERGEDGIRRLVPDDVEIHIIRNIIDCSRTMNNQQNALTQNAAGFTMRGQAWTTARIARILRVHARRR